MQKRIYILALTLFCAMTSSAQAKWNQRYQNYIDKYKDLAIQAMLQYNIPASITLAQGLLESGAGESELARNGNNHFGIKCHGWTGNKIYHDDDARGECFRAYNTVYESYEDHSRFLHSSQRYKSLFSLKNTDYKGWAHGLKAAGYATNPNYANSLITIIETYQLYQYDGNKITVEQKPSYVIPTVKKQPEKYSNKEHVVRMNNKNYYVIARSGDTFKSIGKEFDISYRKLARFNERNRKEALEEGDIIYFKRKRSKADKSYYGKRHVVRAGESMYTISQAYGIRLKALYKMNGLKPDYQIETGEKIRVY